MDTIRSYILTLTAAALICGIFLSLFNKKGMAGTLVKLICGIFMLLTLVNPLYDLDIDHWRSWTKQFSCNAEDAAAAGIQMAEEMRAAIIKERAESYILDKAAVLNAYVQAGVTVTDGIPVSVVIQGNVSPYVKMKLSNHIQDELGISKENQRWNGSP